MRIAMYQPQTLASVQDAVVAIGGFAQAATVPPSPEVKTIEYVHREREAQTVKVPPWPKQHLWKCYWSTLCNNVSSASSRPNEVWILFRQIAKVTTTMESLEGHDGYETLWAKLRTSLMESFQGYFLQEILNWDKKVEVEDKR